MNKMMKSRLLKYVLIIMVGVFVAINIVNARNFDELPTLSLSDNPRDLGDLINVSYTYEAHDVDRIKYLVSYSGDQGVETAQLWGTNQGTYTLNNKFHINNFEIFNLFNKIMGRKTNDKGLITLIIDSEENYLRIYSSSDFYKSKSAIATGGGFFKDVAWSDYEFTLELSESDYHNFNTDGEWNDRVLAQGVNPKNGSKITIFLIYD